MAKNNKSSAGEERRRAQADKMNAELAKEREKAAKKREKDRGENILSRAAQKTAHSCKN